jgi:hypothetical protein
MIPLNLDETKTVEIDGATYTIGRMPGHKLFAVNVAMSAMATTGDSTALVTFIRAGLRDFKGDFDALPQSTIVGLWREIREFNTTTEDAVGN